LDDEGEVLEVLAQPRGNKKAALKLMRKLSKKQGCIPDAIVTDELGSYSVALRELGLAHLHVTESRLNNRVEVSHPLPSSGSFANQERGQRAAENDGWANSNPPGHCNDFCLFTTPSTTISTCSAI
jgi:hypothetical protein